MIVHNIKYSYVNDYIYICILSLACEAFPKCFTSVQTMVAQKKNSNNGQVVAPVGPSMRSQKTMDTDIKHNPNASQAFRNIQKHSEAS